jgi:uncharacterized protein YjgD (DUF1641 family)
MTNEEKILARLDELTEEVREAKRAIRPYVELKQELEPMIHSIVRETTARLSGLDKRVDLEEVGDMVGRSLASSKNIEEAVKTLNSVMDFKRDFEPYSKDMFQELTVHMQGALHGFDGEELQEMLKQFTLNMGNIAEAMKMLNSIVNMKEDAAPLINQAFNDLVERLDSLKKRGLFDDFEHMLAIGERVSDKMKEIDLTEAKPVTGIFGMISALKRPEVQEGLGVLIELSTVMSVLKQKTTDSAQH